MRYFYDLGTTPDVDPSRVCGGYYFCIDHCYKEDDPFCQDCLSDMGAITEKRRENYGMDEIKPSI